MRLLFIGDIVGTPGIQIVERAVPALRSSESLDLVVANAENTAAGSGLTPSTFYKLRTAGIDAFTMGDHIYKKMDIEKLLRRGEPICKPANYPPEAPGREWVIVKARDGTDVAVLSLMGRLYMRPVDCPFRAVDRVLEHIRPLARVIFVDIHAEATGDKAMIGRYLDGKVSAVLGTHTHVPTADECIFPGGTAFQSDVGMTGPHESILGRRIDRILETGITFIPTPFDVATGDLRLNGSVVDIDPETGKATAIRRVVYR
jgi:metallophosphoesterase (TIGR00282 family)